MSDQAMGNALMLFGFSWMVVAAGIGLLLARRHELALESLGEIAAKGDLLAYHRVSEGYKWNKTVHAHAFLFALLAVAVGLAMPRMSISGAFADALGGALIASTVIWTVGGLRSNRVLMVIGDLTLLASVVASGVCMAGAL